MFSQIYDKQGMRVDPEKSQVIENWSMPKDKARVKLFLQTVQFCKVFMRPGGERTYVDVMLPLRRLMSKSVRFSWMKECQGAFDKMKKLLASGQVMAHYDLGRDTRLYVGEVPEDVAATVTQKYTVEGIDHPA